MAMTHDRQKLTDIVSRHYRPTKIGRLSLKNRPTFLGRFLSADKTIGEHVSKPADLSAGILLCDWSAGKQRLCLQDGGRVNGC